MTGTAEDSAQDIQGFLFTRLFERLPHHAENLAAFKQSLLQAQAKDEKVKVWEMQELGFQVPEDSRVLDLVLTGCLQAAQTIVRSSEPMKLLQGFRLEHSQLCCE